MRIVPHPALPAALERGLSFTLPVGVVLDGRRPRPEWAGYRLQVGPETAIVSLDERKTRP